MSSYRERSRRALHDALLDAARDLAVAHGWPAVRMLDVAHAAGVSRQTVYNEFGGKTGLAQALAAREIDGFLAAVRRDLHEHGPDVRAAGEAAIRQVLTAAADNPLVKAVLAGAQADTAGLLPYLTTRADAVVATAAAVVADWAREQLPGAGEETVAVAAETIARLVVSHVVLPTAEPQRTAAVLADVLVRLLA